MHTPLYIWDISVIARNKGRLIWTSISQSKHIVWNLLTLQCGVLFISLLWKKSRRKIEQIRLCRMELCSSTRTQAVYSGDSLDAWYSHCVHFLCCLSHRIIFLLASNHGVKFGKWSRSKLMMEVIDMSHTSLWSIFCWCRGNSSFTQRVNVNALL